MEKQRLDLHGGEVAPWANYGRLMRGTEMVELFASCHGDICESFGVD